METIELKTLDKHSYHSLLREAGGICDAFLLIVRQGNGLSRRASDFLDELRSHQRTVEDVSEWPGTSLIRGFAQKFVYDLNAVSIELLIAAANSPFYWQQPILPEDLCLLRSDGSALLVTISHEHDIYLQLKEEELPLFDDFRFSELAPGFEDDKL